MIFLFLSLLFAVLAVAFELAEKNSRKWYFDRACLRLSGLMAGCAICCVILSVAL